MQTEKNKSLKTFNTFHVNVDAENFYQIERKNEIFELIKSGVFRGKYLIIGCGADLLFTCNFAGAVIKSAIDGIKIISEDDDSAVIEAGSGVIWDDFVKFTLDRNLFGAENLAKIPSTVGAAPVQNIGAYGAEQKDIFESLDAVRLSDGAEIEFSKNDCGFAYRSSVFKSETGETGFFVVSVRYRLKKNPEVNAEYAGIKNYLSDKGIFNPTPAEIYAAVSAIRKNKLPDPDDAGCGNAGSFFKNPVVSAEKFAALRHEYPEIPNYPAPGGVKIPAAWLIEKAGMKGFRRGDAGVSPRHALILQNFGNADGREIFELSEEIIKRVKEKFGIGLGREVIVIR